MITIELIQQLKEAGFPIQYNIAKHVLNKPFGFELDETKEYGYIIPTLSELIESCGDGFSSLINQKRFIKENTIIKSIKEDTPELFWMCCGNNCSATGSTPEEAVALLWLKLNKK